MTPRKIPLANGEYYHIFNRGVGRMPLFLAKKDYSRFTKTFLYYQLQGPKPRFSIFNPDSTNLDPSQRIVEIVAYCLMPNHFHFLLKQNEDNGIFEFISKLSNSFAKYFNIKNRRKGPLLESEFQSVHIETDEQLTHLSRYIHLNPLVRFIVQRLEDHPWSSYKEYLKIIPTNTCSKEIILDQFKSLENYKRFVLDQEDYGKKLERIKHQLLDRQVWAQNTRRVY